MVKAASNFRSTVRWLCVIVAATLVAAIPTRLSSHDSAIGFPFTWHTAQEIVTFGPQPRSFRPWLLFVDIAVVLSSLVLLRFFMRRVSGSRRERKLFS